MVELGELLKDLEKGDRTEEVIKKSLEKKSTTLNEVGGLGGLLQQQVFTWG